MATEFTEHCSNNQYEYKLENIPNRIVVIGDIHGHYDGLLSILLHAGIIDEQLNWIANQDILIQTGDLFGRGNEGKLCADLLMNLQKQAQNHNGNVFVILGNHEAMITHNCFKYIPLAEMYNFTSTLNFSDNPQTKFKQALTPTAKLGNWLRNLPTAIIIDKFLFTHAGIEPYWAEFGIEKLNEITRKCMFDERYYSDFTISMPIISPIGPLWNRRLINPPENQYEQYRQALYETLDLLNVEKMIVGHTPSVIIPPYQAGTIVRQYNDNLIGVDVGINPVFGGYNTWLEILANGEIISRNTWTTQPTSILV